MMTTVTVHGLITFAPNLGFHIEDVDRAIAEPELLNDALVKAKSHINNPLLRDACCGGQGPLADRGDLEFDEFVELVQRFGRQ